MSYCARPTWQGPTRNEFECDECGCVSPIGEDCWYCAEQSAKRTASDDEGDGQ